MFADEPHAEPRVTVKVLVISHRPRNLITGEPAAHWKRATGWSSDAARVLSNADLGHLIDAPITIHVAHALRGAGLGHLIEYEELEGDTDVDDGEGVVVEGWSSPQRADASCVETQSQLEQRTEYGNACSAHSLPHVLVQKKQDSTAARPALVVLTTDAPLPGGSWVLVLYWGDGASDSIAFTGPGTPAATFSHSFGTAGWVSESRVYMNWGMLGAVGKQVAASPPAHEVLVLMAVSPMVVNNHVG